MRELTDTQTLDWLNTKSPPSFDGTTFDARVDATRLGGQLAVVRKLMEGGMWWTIPTLARLVGASEAGVSARIRDLRKQKFGGHTIERRRVIGGLYQYRMVQ